MTRPLSALALAIGITLGWAATAPAASLTWSTPRELPGRYTDVDTPGPPDLAINRTGDIVVSWIGDQGGTEVAVGSPTRGLRVIRTPRTFSGLPVLAISKTGQSLVSWSDDLSDDERVVQRYVLVSRGGKVGRTRVLDHAGYEARFVPQPDGSFLAIYLGSTRKGVTVRARRIAPSGRAGRITVLGRPHDEDDFDVAAAAGGQAIVCCRRGTAGPTGVWTFSPAKGFRAVATDAAPGAKVGAIATAGGAYSWTTYGPGASTPRTLHVLRAGVLTRTAIASAGEAWTLDARGRPLRLIDGAAVLSAQTAGFDGVLAPVAELGPQRDRTLSNAAVSAPWGPGAVIAWPDARRWRVATEVDGVFETSPAPTGVVGYPGAWSAGDAVALSWYDNNHHAFVSFGQPEQLVTLG
jgi:hypothetical protein